MDKTYIIALYAAVVATLVLLWDIYKWRASGPRIILAISPNMKIHGDPRYPHTYITVEAINKGNLPTTITKLAVQNYRNRFFKILRIPKASFIIAASGLSDPLPHVLESGKVWHGLVHQNEETEQMAKEGLLFCELYLSHRKKPKVARVVMRS